MARSEDQHTKGHPMPYKANDELFPVVDNEGTILGSAYRSEVHGNPALVHPVVHCLITDTEGRILLQLRSKTKDIQPDRWDTSVGGHVAWGETVEQALARELSEEVGVRLADVRPRFLYRYRMTNQVESELVFTFACTTDGPFQRQESEVQALRFWTHEAIQAALGTGTLTPNFEEEYRRFRAATAARSASVP